MKIGLNFVYKFNLIFIHPQNCSISDTVLGLEALTKYATAMSVNSTEMLVLVTAGPSNEHTFKMNDDNKMVLSSVAIPDLPSEVNIFAEGEGCVLIQVHFSI